MSDELEHPEQNDNQQADEALKNETNESEPQTVENESEITVDNESGMNNEDASVIDNPEVQESLKQLSMHENADKATIIHTPDSVKNIVEAAILAASKAISLDKLLTLFPEGEVIDKSVLRQAIEQIMHDYQSRGIELVEVSSGYRFQVTQTVAPWVARLWEEKPQKYSRALLETLALVAYRQPITRGEIEEIRGVSVSSQIMRTLVDREWVRVIGHRDVPGKPAMYATTRQFLDYFGLKKLDELPSLSEIRDLDTINAELDFGDGEEKASDEEKSDTPIGIESEQTQLHIEVNNAEYNEPEQLGETEDHIDIDAELAALKKTYQQLDSIDAVEKLNELDERLAQQHHDAEQDHAGPEESEETDNKTSENNQPD